MDKILFKEIIIFAIAIGVSFLAFIQFTKILEPLKEIYARDIRRKNELYDLGIQAMKKELDKE